MNDSDLCENLTIETVFLSNTSNSNSSEIVAEVYEQQIAISIILGLLIIFTVLGNVSVILAIYFEKNLQTKGNCLVLSLAVADLMVACLVMPLGAMYEVKQNWTFGIFLCDIWTSCDVLCCTASILHLVAIAIDRYWAVTDIDYMRQRQPWHVGLTITIVWSVAVFISIAPLVGWRDEQHEYRVLDEKRCLVSQDTGYQLFATFSTFYVPLFIILFLYWQIFRVARKRIRHRPGNHPDSQLVSATVLVSMVTEMTMISTTTSSSHPNSDDFLLTKQPAPKKRPKGNVCSKKERKAAKTLTVITGAFVFCWLPFFIMALMMPLCEQCQPSNQVFSFALWLGYTNSLLNPIIYTVFSPDFRTGFKNLYASRKRYCRCLA